MLKQRLRAETAFPHICAGKNCAVCRWKRRRRHRLLADVRELVASLEKKNIR